MKKKLPLKKTNRILVENQEPLKEIKTVLDFIDFSAKKREKLVNDTLGGIIGINKVSLFRENLSKRVFIVMELKDHLEEENYTDYTIVSRMFPYGPEDLRPESIERNLDFDSWYFPVKIRRINNKSYIYAQVSDDVDGFLKVILQLINKKTKKISPKKITILNLEA